MQLWAPRRRPAFGALAAFAAMVCLCADPAPSLAEPPSPEALAKDAYDRGTAAYRSGDYAVSATEYARADELHPNDVALQAALESAVLADDVLLGMALLERSRRGPPTGGLETAITAARAKFSGRAGRIRAACGARASCSVTVDGVAVDVRSSPWFRVGTHKVVIAIDGRSDERTVEVVADTVVDVAPSETPSRPPPTAKTTALASPPSAPTSGGAPVVRGLSPAWVAIGGGLTLVLAGAATWSGVDTASKHDDFVGGACDRAPSEGCTSLASDGKDAQLRTNILFGATALTGIATAAVGLFFVRWSPERRGGSSLSISPGIGSTAVRVTF